MPYCDYCELYVSDDDAIRWRKYVSHLACLDRLIEKVDAPPNTLDLSAISPEFLNLRIKCVDYVGIIQNGYSVEIRHMQEIVHAALCVVYGSDIIDWLKRKGKE